MANFYQRFLQSSRRWPDNIAVEMQYQNGRLDRYTFAELERMAAAVASWLYDQQLPSGTKCAILAPNGPRWMAAYLGIIGSGNIAVPLDTAFNPEQISKLLRCSGSSLLFASAQQLSTVANVSRELPLKLVLLDDISADSPDVAAVATTFSSLIANVPGKFEPAPAATDDTAAILYTSGTTSDPKGVMLTHGNFAAETGGAFSIIPDIGPADAILGILPLFHALAQMVNLLLPIAAGARVVFLDSLNTTELMRALREREITIFCCVPQFFYLIHERIYKEIGARSRLAQTGFRTAVRLASLGRQFHVNLGKLFFRPVHALFGPRMRYLVSGGSRLDPNIARDFQALGFDLLQGYGLTETCGGVTCTRPDDNVIGSVGRPLPDNEISILEPHDSDGATPAAGEIAVRGTLVMKGYYDRPDATAQVLRDGWLHTGDLGYIGARGNLFVTGRAKDVIVLSSGKNVYPEELEAHFAASPLIKECCIVGLESRPGEPYSEKLHAVIVPNFDVLRERHIVNAREAIRFDFETLSAQLPATKRPLSYDIWQEDLPRTTTRKIKRFEVERRLREQQTNAAANQCDISSRRPITEDDRAWLERPEVTRAIEVIREAAKTRVPEVHPGDNLELDLGLDSMERVELLVAVEQTLGASVPDARASQVYTVRELVDAVLEHAGTRDETRERNGWESILATEPTDPEVLAVTEDRPISTHAWFLFGRFVQMFSRDFFRLRAFGVDKLPQNGPYIIAPNHQSFLDAPVLLSLFPYARFNNMFYVGTSEIFGSGLARRLAKSIKLVPVDPDANLVPAMRAGAYGLRKGKILLMFPEGERTIDGTPKIFKKGAAILSAHLRVPIYPVALDGFFETWPRGKSLQKFSPLGIAVGDPIYPPAESCGDMERIYTETTAELKSRVMKMWNALHSSRSSPAQSETT